MLSSIEFKIVFFLVSWSALVLFISFTLVRKAYPKMPPEKRQNKGGFIYTLPVFALLFWLVYNLCLALASEKLRRPCRSCDIDTYWNMHTSAAGFWGYFGFIYLLTVFVAVILTVSIILFFKNRANPS